MTQTETAGAVAFDWRHISRGDLVRVVKCPGWEYLTVGEVYRADGDGWRGTLGLHRPGNGAGTYIQTKWLGTGHIVLAPAGADHDHRFRPEVHACPVEGCAYGVRS